MVNVEITEQSQRDLMLMESLAIPISFLVLVWVFGGALAAAVPLAVGGTAILGALAVLRGITHFADGARSSRSTSSAAMGLALAIDYTLLIISRYRDEFGGRREPRRRAGTDHGDGGPHRRVLGDDRGPVDGRDGRVSDGLSSSPSPTREWPPWRSPHWRLCSSRPAALTSCSAPGWRRWNSAPRLLRRLRRPRRNRPGAPPVRRQPWYRWTELR